MARIPDGDDEGVFTKEFKARIRRGMADVREGRTYTERQIKKFLEDREDIAIADKIMTRIRKGKEKLYSEEDIMKKLFE